MNVREVDVYTDNDQEYKRDITMYDNNDLSLSITIDQRSSLVVSKAMDMLFQLPWLP
jgi:hypothetical protein